MKERNEVLPSGLMLLAETENKQMDKEYIYTLIFEGDRPRKRNGAEAGVTGDKAAVVHIGSLGRPFCKAGIGVRTQQSEGMRHAKA